jgi:UDP-2,3-diacylglucosamine hydrolase
VTSQSISIKKVQSEVIALFVSDVHLNEKLPLTTQAFIDLIESYAGKTQHLFLLGDLFEYWAGDDDMESAYHQRIISVLQNISLAGCQLYWIAGNRDFLIGDAFAKKMGMQLLPDPSCITLLGKTFLIAHGDAQCTDDVAYLRFRNMVRQDVWQTEFLKRPLQERKAIIEQMRQASVEGQKQKTMEIMDVNADAIEKLFVQNKVTTIIHGHTHRPALHLEKHGLRYVLPDWNCDHHLAQASGGWLTLNHDGEFYFHRLSGEITSAW